MGQQELKDLRRKKVEAIHAKRAARTGQPSKAIKPLPLELGNGQVIDFRSLSHRQLCEFTYGLLIRFNRMQATLDNINKIICESISPIPEVEEDNG